mgnify:CR=1 FL=1
MADVSKTEVFLERADFLTSLLCTTQFLVRVFMNDRFPSKYLNLWERTFIND